MENDEENKKRRRPVDESILGESPKKPRVEETLPGVASVVKTSPGVEKKTVSEIKVERTMSTNSVEPPAFISENRSYAEYKADLKMWSADEACDDLVLVVKETLEELVLNITIEDHEGLID